MPSISCSGFSQSFFRKLSRKITQSFTYFVCALLTFQPMMVELAYAQEIIIDPSGNVGFAPTMQRTSRPQVVDIATPNTGGVSHNQYTRFDVTSKGVVLNNSQTATGTELAGNISGNANLSNGTAVTIVNEVTSTDTSALNGAIEVAGTRANVIIANPNGITCSGCNFINAGTGTLTTGVPVIDGSTVRLDVTQGAITIGRAGLNGSANNVSNINLIGRTVVIDGKVTAIDGIAVQGGAQSYDVTNSRKTAALTGVGTTPDFVVDGTEFGAMEAGRIQIIGNESGLGVRVLGAVRSTTQDVRIINEGDATVRSVAAHGQVQLFSRYGSLTIERDVTSATSNVVAYARRDVSTTSRTGLYGFTGVEITARKGTLTFGGDLQSGANVNLYGDRLLTFAGYGSATGEFKLRGLREITVDGATIVANEVVATEGGHTFTLNSSAIFSANNFQINTVTFNLGKDVVVDGLTDADVSNLIVNATGAFHNSADLRRHTAATITYAGNLYNEAGGIIEETNLNIASTNEVHNSGILYGTNSLNLDIAALFNNEGGVILSDTISINTSGLLENKGTITSEGSITLTSANKITNDGYIQGIHAYLTAPVILNNGELRVQNNAQINASSTLTNNGVLASLVSVRVTAGHFENAGLVSVENTIGVIADTITNHETLTAGVYISLQTTGNILNTGQIASYGNALLDSDATVENRGNILVDNVVDVRGAWFINTGADAVLRANIGRINTASIRNSGQVYLIADFQRRRNIDYFENDGVFATAGKIEIQGRDVNSRAILRAGSVLISGLQPEDDAQDLVAAKSTLLKFNSLTLDGRISAGGNVTLYGPSSMLISGTVETKQNLTLMADTLTLGADSRIYAEGRGVFRVSTKFTNDGVISLGSSFELGVGFGSFRNNNLITAASTRKFTVNGTFDNRGVMQASDHLSIKAANIYNRGHLQAAGGNVWLTASQSSVNDLGETIVTPGTVYSSGTISASGQAGLFGRRAELATGSYLSATQLRVTADRFYNKGAVALSGDGRNDWNLSEGLWQYGNTYADGEIRLITGSIATYENSLLGTGATLRVVATGSVSLGGSFVGNDIILSAASLYGTTKASILSSNDIRITTPGRAKYYGEIAAADDVIIDTDSFDLYGNTFGARVELTGSSRSYSRGSIFANETVNVTVADTYYNLGLVEARDKVTVIANSVTNSAGASISSTEVDLRSTVTSIVNTGRILGARKITFTSASGISNNFGGSITTVSLGLKSASFANRGEIDVYGFFGDVSGKAYNYGAIAAQTYFGFDVGTFYNREGGSITSDDHLFIRASGGITNSDTARLSGNVIDLRAASFSNSGEIEAANIVNIADVTGTLRNTATGSIYGQTIALLAGSDIQNDGIIGQTSSGSLPQAEVINISSVRNVKNYGQISSDDVRILANRSVTNEGTIQTAGFLGLKSTNGNVTSTGILRANEAIVEAYGTFDNQGLIRASEHFYASAATILNRNGTARNADIEATRIVLNATGSITNSGRLFGYEVLGLNAENGDIDNDGVITGLQITLLARNGRVESQAGIWAGGTLAIEAESIGLLDQVRVTNTVSLKSTLSDIEVGGVIRTENLYVDAARNIVAANQVFRGSQLTQLIANDILRSDTSSLTGKLATISDATKDVYVQLRTGSIGIVGPARYDAAGHAYDQATWDVTGSISLIANVGDILVSGTLRAADDLYISSGHDTLLGSGSFSAGDILHLQGDKLLKNYGSARIDSGNKVQLLQNEGWFYTADWLTGDLDYHLSVQANTIVVNSSHRLINKDIFLRARNDIWQTNRVISARKVTYSAGHDITIRFDPFATSTRDLWNHYGLLSSLVLGHGTGSWWDVDAARSRGHTLISQSHGTTIYAGRNIHFVSGKIHSAGDLDIIAGGNILSEPIYKETGRTDRPDNVGWSFSSKYQGVQSGHTASKVEIRELRAYENKLSAAGDVSIIAGGSASFIGTSIVSTNGDISIEALNGGIYFVAAPGFWSYNYTNTTVKKRLLGLYKKITTYQVDSFEDIYKRSKLLAANGNITIASTGTDPDYASVLSAGTLFEAQNISISTPNGNISAGTYAERSINETSVHSSTKIFFIIPFGSSDTTITDNILINYGNDFTADEILDIAAPQGTLSITGGTLTAQQINLTAARLNINAAIDSTRHTFFSERDNMITITTIQSGFDRETAVLPTITSTNTPVFNISGEVHIAGVRGATLNSQLVNVIGSRQFDNEFLGLASPEDLANAATEGEEVEEQYLRDFVLPGATDGDQFAYLDILMNDYNATYHTISLRDREWYDKQVRLNPAFKALLQAVAAYITGGLNFNFGNAFLNAGVEAATTNLIVGAAEGAITGNFDLDEILRGALLAGVSTTISSFLTDQINLGAGLSDQSPFANDLRGQFSPAAIVNRAGDAVINNGVSNLVHGQDFFDGLDQVGRTFLVTETIAIAQFGIGELGNGSDTQWEGSIGHLLLHGGIGCLALEALNGDCVAGFFSGASSSLLAGSNLTDEQILRLAPLLGALTGFVFSGGDAVNVSFGGTVAQSAIINNYLTHTQWNDFLTALEECGSNQICIDTLNDTFGRISAQQQHELAMCGTDVACLAPHLSELINNQLNAAELMALLQQVSPGSVSNGIWILEQQAAQVYLGLGGGYNPSESYVGYAAWANASCSEMLGSECMIAFQTDVIIRDAALQGFTAGAASVGVGLVIGLTGGVAIEFGPAGLAAMQRCLGNVVCVNELAILAGEVAAGDALGGGTLHMSVAAGGRIVMRVGDEIVGVFDDAGRILIRVDDSYGAFVFQNADGVYFQLDGTGQLVTPRGVDLIAELVSDGANITSDSVVTIVRLQDGRIVWLETGNTSSGLEHIVLEHGTQFEQWGVRRIDIPEFVIQAVTDNNVVGTSSGLPVYLVGNTPTAVLVADNGYIVTAYPVTTFERY